MQNIAFNGISAGTGGGLTVARDLAQFVAASRPECTVSLLLIDSHPLHEELRGKSHPFEIEWMPTMLKSRRKRKSFESRNLPSFLKQKDVSVIVQLNGMFTPGLHVPQICHFQDPWPYRKEAQNGLKDTAIAFLKRRAHAKTIRNAEFCGWTSNYLQNLICGYHGFRPRAHSVFYNGVPDAWLGRSDSSTAPLSSRPMSIATVGNVFPYKRQELVIRAVAKLVESADFSDLKYYVLGQVTPEYMRHLNSLVKDLGVPNNVSIEGRVSNERISNILESVRAMPLMSVCESFGIPAIEAMTFGTPVVVSNCCALPEVVGDAGLISPTDDLGALVENLTLLLSDDGLAEAYRKRGFVRAKEFSWQATARQIAETVDSLLAK